MVENFPLLVRLDGDWFDFKQARRQGEDIRFSTTDGAALHYEIERWDGIGARAEIWVRMPRIRGDTIQAIRMHWGHPEARSESDGAAVFGTDNGFGGVWHLGDHLRDATPNGLNGTDKGTTATRGIIGDGRVFGTNAYVHCGDEVDCLPRGDADRSMSAWINPSSYDGGPTIGGWGKQGAQHLSYLTLSNRGRVKFHGYAADPEGVTQAPFGEWHHVQASISGGRIRFYFHGQLEHSTKIRTLDTSSPSACFIGKHTPPGGRWSRPFMGMLDEVRYDNVARSAAWARLCYENQRPLQSLVGPLVADEDELSLAPATVRVEEGDDITLEATAKGALKLSWIVHRHGEQQVQAVDQSWFGFAPGRTVSDDRATVELRALYPDGVRSRSTEVVIDDVIPEPDVRISGPDQWDGTAPITLRATVQNQEAMNARQAGDLHFNWELSGPAVVHEVSGTRLVLEQALGTGALTVTLSVDNGGHPSVRTRTISVTAVTNRPWARRAASTTERPEDHQFVARDDTGQGDLWFAGKLEQPADHVFLRISADGKPDTMVKAPPAADGSFALRGKLNAGLISYNATCGVIRDGEESVLHEARDIVCGDAYIIQGQSNAEAFDMGRAAHPHVSPWIRSFGSPRSDPERARMARWGNAAGFERKEWALQIGYWGMELARQLVEEHQLPIFVINGAKGGTRIDQHQRDGEDPTNVETIYGRLLWRLREARLTHGVRGLFWHQGENDQGSAGPGGLWGWQSYNRYFKSLAADWRRDYPNISHLHVFQIWPRACSMGHQGSDDRLREVQRRLSRDFEHLHVISTVGVRPPGGCHYPPEGYAELAKRIAPLVHRDHYGRKSEAPITAPDLQRAEWAGESRTRLHLTFDQPVDWSDDLGPRFYLDGEAGLVTTATVDDRVLTLQLGGPSTARHITYLKGTRWNRKDPVLRGLNGIAALTFCRVPIHETTAVSPFDRNRRGDRLLKAGRAEEAIADFDAYIQTQPRAEPYHWQRGIAHYYAGRFDDGVRQFEIHRTVNPNDVENAAWHFLCKARLDGVAAARAALLPVLPDRRVPMMTVYELFAGRATPEQVLRDARAAADTNQAESALFYAHLYLGLYHEALGDPDRARLHINLAATTHTSPHYMGDIARMHAALVQTLGE